MVAPNNIKEFLNLIKKRDIKHEIMHENVGKLIERQLVRSTNNQEFGWTSYHTLEEIYDWMDSLEAEFPSKIELLNAGSSYEGRPLKGVKISHGRDKPVIFIESGIHANEWITSATATYLINELLNSEDTRIRDLAESYDWYIFPIINPDGFAYTHNVVIMRLAEIANIYIFFLNR